MSDDALKNLMEMMSALRSPEKGCPWDKKQTYQSLTPHTLEETHEVIDAIEQNNFTNLKDELGDLLFQVVFYSQIAREQNRFDLLDVINNLVEKMHRRHPHVFADHHFDSEAELSSHWDNIKTAEKLANHTQPHSGSVLDNVPVSMPALSRAQKLQKRAAKTGFDWNNINLVKEKLHEELEELDVAIESGDQAEIEHEMGDLILTAVNLARHLDVDAEQALRLANQRFKKRFQHIENSFRISGKSMTDSGLNELEALWQAAKKI